MRVSWAKMALVTVMAVTSLATITSAMAQQAPDSVHVNITLQDAEMLTATATLTKLTGLQFVIEPSDKAFGKINCKLKDVSAEDAIRYICDSAGAFYRRDENDVYVISRDKPAEKIETKVVEPLKVKKTVKRIKILKANPRAVYEQIMYAIPYDSNRAWEDLNKFRSTVNHDGFKGGGSTVLNMGLNPVPQSYTPVAAQQAPQPRTSQESGSQVSVPGDGADQLGGGGRGGGGQGFGGGGQGGGGGLGGGGGIGGQGQGARLVAGQGLVGASIDFIDYDPTDNSIVVRGTEEDIADLQKYITLFDVAPRQVIIKVEFITTSNSLSTSIGYDWLYQRGTISAGSQPGVFARSGDPIFLNFATGNVTSRLRTQLLQGYGTVVNAPIIRTLNNEPANVTSSTQTVIFISQTIIGANQVITVPVPQPFTAQTTLAVAPRINDDNTITMFLSPQIQDFGQVRRSPDGNEIPDILSEAVNVVARVKNGETIVLGGLTRKSETGSQIKFPILGDLPIIGQFFRANTKDRNNSQLLVFVTPTIVEDDESAGGG